MLSEAQHLRHTAMVVPVLLVSCGINPDAPQRYVRVDEFPPDEHDLPVSAIVTPEEIIRVGKPPRAPSRIRWDELTDEDLDAMPILRELERGGRAAGRSTRK
ncbi:MAG TPA: hypothetical protein VF980_13590 [Thermoanaerobaculia bacterium]